MTIHPISGLSAAVYITPADLRQWGMTAQSVTIHQALALTRDALRQAGISPEGQLELDVFPDESGVLLFARVKPPEELAFSFAGLEDVVSALHALRPPLPGGALFWWENRYWLLLPGGADEQAASLSEFGRTESSGVNWRGRLEEYGRVILPKDAPALFRRYFPLSKPLTDML